MEAKAIARFVRVAPRKARVVAKLIREKYVDEALEQLRFTDKGAADPVGKVLKSAIANAKGLFDAAPERLFVKDAFVNQGPTLKRWRPRAMGRATRINKCTSHITVVVAER
jgi:large subunit ribosomal protein L22